MKRQKRVAVINDVTGFGRCSAAVAQPIISAMKIQCCVMPTAILSVHTGFPNYFLQDYTPYLRTYMNSWEETGIEFDGITTGFIGSKEQIGLVIEFFKRFKKENTLAVVDPVMGDYGKLYSSYTDDMCQEMKKLLPYADVLTPNLTEACRILDLDYHKVDLSEEFHHNRIGIKQSQTGHVAPEFSNLWDYPRRVESCLEILKKLKTDNLFTEFAYDDICTAYYTIDKEPAKIIQAVITY